MRYEFPGRRSAAGYTIATRYLPSFLPSLFGDDDGAAAVARNSILSLATPPRRAAGSWTDLSSLNATLIAFALNRLLSFSGKRDR